MAVGLSFAYGALSLELGLAWRPASLVGHLHTEITNPQPPPPRQTSKACEIPAKPQTLNPLTFLNPEPLNPLTLISPEPLKPLTFLNSKPLNPLILIDPKPLNPVSLSKSLSPTNPGPQDARFPQMPGWGWSFERIACYCWRAACLQISTTGRFLERSRSHTE